MFSLIKPLLFKLDPETAHNLVIKSLKLNYLPKSFFDVENEEMLESRGRAIEPGDIMILLRQRSHFMEELVKALKQNS